MCKALISWRQGGKTCRRSGFESAVLGAAPAQALTGQSFWLNQHLDQGKQYSAPLKIRYGLRRRPQPTSSTSRSPCTREMHLPSCDEIAQRVSTDALVEKSGRSRPNEPSSQIRGGGGRITKRLFTQRLLRCHRVFVGRRLFGQGRASSPKLGQSLRCACGSALSDDLRGAAGRPWAGLIGSYSDSLLGTRGEERFSSLPPPGPLLSSVCLASPADA